MTRLEGDGAARAGAARHPAGRGRPDRLRTRALRRSPGRWVTVKRAQSASGTSTTPRSSSRWRVPSSGSARAPEHEGLAVAQPEPGGRLPDEAGRRRRTPSGRSSRGCSSAPVLGAHDLDDELGRVGRERHLAALAEVGEQAHPGPVGGAQQGDPARAEVVEEDRVRHPAVAERAHRPAVGVGDRGEGVAVVVGERDPAEAVVAAGEGLPRDARCGSSRRATPGTTGRTRSCSRAGSARSRAARPGVAVSMSSPTGVCSGSGVAVVEEAAEGTLPRGPGGGRGRPADGGRAPAAARAPRRRRRRRACSRPPPGRCSRSANAAQVEPPADGVGDRGERHVGLVGLAVAAGDPAGGVGAVVVDSSSSTTRPCLA